MIFQDPISQLQISPTYRFWMFQARSVWAQPICHGSSTPRLITGPLGNQQLWMEASLSTHQAMMVTPFYLGSNLLTWPNLMIWLAWRSSFLTPPLVTKLVSAGSLMRIVLLTQASATTGITPPRYQFKIATGFVTQSKLEMFQLSRVIVSISCQQRVV